MGRWLALVALCGCGKGDTAEREWAERCERYGAALTAAGVGSGEAATAACLGHEVSAGRIECVLAAGSPGQAADCVGGLPPPPAPPATHIRVTGSNLGEHPNDHALRWHGTLVGRIEACTTPELHPTTKAMVVAMWDGTTGMVDISQLPEGLQDCVENAFARDVFEALGTQRLDVEFGADLDP